MGSNHADSAEAYWRPISDWMPSARAKAQVQAELAGVTCASDALYYNCHIAPWGMASLDPMSRYMSWNAAHAVLLFVNHFEYTRNVTFARDVTLPLLSGIASWYASYLRRDATTGVWHDDNTRSPDMEHEEQRVADPQIALALIQRVMDALIDISAAAGVAVAPVVADIAAHLTTPNAVNVTLPNGPWSVLPNTRCSDVTASWTFYDVSDVAACEAACDATPTCALFSYCPPVAANNRSGCTGRDGEPRPFTCWGMPISQLPHCTNGTANVGWVSGYRGNSTQRVPVWTGFRGATPADSDWFASYPIWPSESLDPRSPWVGQGVAETARASVALYGSDFAGGRGVDLATAAVRAGYAEGATAPGFAPSTILAGIEAFLSRTWGPSLLPTAVGGGIENTGMSRAVNEMLLAAYALPPQVGAAREYALALFPSWPPEEPAAFQRLLAKGGFLVSAGYDNATRAIVSPLRVVAAHVLGGGSATRCTLLRPWGAGVDVAASCGGASVPVTHTATTAAFDAPRGVECEVSPAT